MKLFTKADIAEAKSVTPRTIDNWVASGWLPRPLKLGTAKQSRVRWTSEHVAALDRKLAEQATV
jgi:hypothetical protein